jgi:hypothetical protein
MSGLGKLGPLLIGVLAGYLACRLLPRGWLGVALSCMSSLAATTIFLRVIDRKKFEAHFVVVDSSTVAGWFLMCSLLGLLGYVIRHWYEPWIDSLRAEDSEDSRNSDNASFIRDKLKVLNARRLSRRISRRESP